MGRRRELRRPLAALIVVAIATFAACALQLGEVEQATVVITVDNAGDFGDVPVGMTGTLFVTITPATGNQSDTITNITESCNDFGTIAALPGFVYQNCGSASGGSGACTSQSYMFSVTFSPTGTGGPESCAIQIYITDSAGGSYIQPANVHGNGTIGSKLIAIQPPSQSLGDVKVNTQSTTAATVTILNTGAQDLSISGASVADTAQFAITSGTTTSHTLPHGSNESFAVRCTPASTGMISTTLTVVNDSTNLPNAVATIICNGTNSSLSIDQNTFGSHRVGDSAHRLVITVSDSGADATITSYSLTGAAAELSILTGDPSTTTGLITSMTTRSVALRYDPAVTHPLGPLGTLVIHYDTGATYNAVISGEAVPATMAVSSAAVEFGPLCLDQADAKDVTIYANNAGGYRVDTVDLTAPASPFMTTTTPALPFDVPPLNQDQLVIEVKATPTTPGDFSSHVVVTTDLPSNNVLDIPVHAKGLIAGVAATPDSLDFGLIHAQTVSSVMTVQLTNCSTGSLDVQTATIDGANATEFVIVAPQPADVAQTVAHQASMELQLLFHPLTQGRKDAMLTIGYGGGSASVALVGQADRSSNDPGDVARETYYACSSGRPAGAALPALALVMLVRRRRVRR